MTVGVPIEAVWNGEVFRPVSAYWQRRADKQYAQGEVLRIVDEPERSGASHRHYFAAVNRAHENLPELLAERFPTPEHLRKYALIRAGFCDTQSMPCPSHAAALRFAAFVRPIDEFALVTVTDTVVTVYRAKSQSYRAMSKKEFQESKDRVLDIIAEIIGVAKDELNEPSQLEYLAAG